MTGIEIVLQMKYCDRPLSFCNASYHDTTLRTNNHQVPCHRDDRQIRKELIVVEEEHSARLACQQAFPCERTSSRRY